MGNSSNSKVAKNTLFLYFRMMITMLVSLYTVRVVLSTLGAVDYGLYNVIGGVVAMFAFLSGTLATASQRFFSFELGRKDFTRLKKIFSISLLIYIGIGIAIVLLAETVGLWFLNHKMTIPAERLGVANWVYQFSILSFLMTMFTIPYNASIIAHEKMNVYAYVSIAEVALKLLIVFLLTHIDYDKLVVYAMLMLVVTFLVTGIYRIYCVRNFQECRFHFFWDRGIFNELVGFSGWNLIGTFAYVTKEQGLNILLNLFFSPAVNAARGIAYQVSTVLNSFVVNLQTALNPRITKLYAEGDTQAYVSMINQGAKFSYYLLLLLSLPIFLEIDFILGIWLDVVPDYTEDFIRLILLILLVDSFYRTVVIGITATGKIKWLQIVVGGLNMLILPLSYFFLKLGSKPDVVFYVSLCISVVGIIPRLVILKNVVPSYSIKVFLQDVVFRIVFVTGISFGFSVLFKSIVWFEGWYYVVSVVFFSAAMVLLSIYFVGLSSKEKALLQVFIKNKLDR